MELQKQEHDSLEALVREWTEHPEQELEATFRMQGGLDVDLTAFLDVAKRLKKSYKELPQLERLTVMVDDPGQSGLRRQATAHTRFTLEGSGVILQYCEDNEMSGKPFVAIIKDRAGPGGNVDLLQYDTRVKVRREIPLGSDDPRVTNILKQWPNMKKGFRLIKRWSFVGDGLQFDLSMIYSTKRDSTGQFVSVKNYLDEDITKNPPSYEIEVELKHTTENNDPKVALQTLMKGLVEVLRGLQKSPILIRNKVRGDVLANYTTLMEGKRRFRGVAPNTLELRNFVKAQDSWETSLWEGYNVTDKADGLRVLAYCDPRGELFLLDMSLNVYRTALLRDACKNSVLDGEWITRDKHGKGIQQLLLFDAYVINGEKVHMHPFYDAENTDIPQRYTLLTQWTSTWNDVKTESRGPTILAKNINQANKLQVSRKRFEFATAGNPSIFTRAAATMLAEGGRALYNTDGLIFTPNKDPLPDGFGILFKKQFKWKPSKDNTIDFLVRIVKDKESGQDLMRPLIREGTDVPLYYKTLRLMVGHNAHPAFENPRQAILMEQQLPFGTRAPGQNRDYRPAEFTPMEFPDPDNMASTCYLEIQTDPKTNKTYVITEDNEPIQDLSIVEFRYDMTEKMPGWRWKPVRVRTDKTARYARGELGRTLNNEEVAESVWNSIHDPITESMITSGALQPSVRERAEMAPAEPTSQGEKVYYQRKAPVSDLMIIRGLRQFHNRYIKEKILLRVGLGETGGRTVADLSVGQGSDIGRWIRSKVKFAYGQDIAGFGITDPRQGAYRRYLKEVMRAKRQGEAVVPMVFAVGDSTKFIPTGDSGETPLDKDIMRFLFGAVRPEGRVPPFVQRQGEGILRSGVDCTTLMFTIHYMFETKDTLHGLLRNLDACVKVGGYFVGCCFDGDAVFNMFQEANIKKGGKVFREDNGKLIWSITKQYDDEVLPTDDEGFGKAIDVEFISIGAKHREYLVPFELLVKKMKKIGLELLTPEECAAVGLQNSTNLFKDSWEMARDGGMTFEMPREVAEYSFLNRWFIFKRKNDFTMTEDDRPELEEVKEEEDEKEEQKVPEVPVAVAPPLPRGPPPSLSGLPRGTPGYTPPPLPKGPPPPLPPASSAKAQGPRLRGGDAPEMPDAKLYELNDLFQFHIDAPLVDKLGMGDTGAARWLSPISRFPIYDGEDEYPSLEHYIAAMKYKYGARKADGTPVPQLAKGLFGQKGTVHQQALRYESVQLGDKQPTEEDTARFLAEEQVAIQKQLKPAGFKANKVIFDEASWLQHRDEVIQEGVEQRWNKDARFRRILEAARNQGKTLLYYTGATGISDLGGIRRSNKQIDGNNRLGKMMMEAAGFLDA